MLQQVPPVLLLIVATSFGEVDWIIPVLHRFKQRHPEWQIITLFGHEAVFYNLQRNKTLYDEFTKVSSLNIVPQEIDLLLTRNISPQQVRIILKDYNKDEFAPYKQYLAERCPDALQVNYPHSNHIYGNKETDPVRRADDPAAFSRHDLVLLCSEHDIPHWSGVVESAAIRVTGYPRYDDWWLQRLLRAGELAGSAEARLAREAEHVVFWISRGPHPHYLSQQDYDYLLHSVMLETLSREKSVVLIKPHPRQDINELLAMLRPYDPQRWMISGLHLVQLASLADVVVSGWSSGILDSLAVDTPVIEFWKFGGRDPLCRMDADKKPTTIYRELGLAAGADSREELRELLHEALTAPDGDGWRRQREAFQRCCKQQRNAAEAAVCILDTALRLDGGGEQPEEVQKVIDAEIAKVENFMEAGDSEEARRLLNDLAGHYPTDPHVLNNLGVFLFNEGDMGGAVQTLSAARTASPLAVEPTVNLLHILLESDYLDEAAGVVLSFYGNDPDDTARESFREALQAQFPPQQAHKLREVMDIIQQRCVA